jgi:uncharacterized DUF497 family protein
VEFEFDPDKSERNKAKHGIDFIQAQALWKAKRVLLHAKEALESDIWSSGRSRASTGPPLSPIAERRFGLLV